MSMSRDGPDVVVIGRVSADFPPKEIETGLDAVSGFRRTVGGFGGNVATGLARLGTDTALIACVGEDGHGRFIRRFLAGEGVGVEWLRAVAGERTALAFFEVWPPDRFPVTFYPSPTYWSTQASDLPLDAIRSCRILIVSGTALAREPSRAAVLRAMSERRADRRGALRTILDLDWRPALWSRADDYSVRIGTVLPLADIVIAGSEEFAAARVDPRALAASTPIVVIKRGQAGLSVHSAGEHVSIPGIPVETVCGLGAGDAFIAAFAAGLLADRTPLDAARRGNAAGAIVASRLACSEAMPKPAEIDRLLRGGIAAPP